MTFTPGHSGYSVCERSGFRARRDELVKDGHKGLLVLPRYCDPESNNRPYRSRSGSGPLNAETSDNFIANSVAPEDL